MRERLTQILRPAPPAAAISDAVQHGRRQRRARWRVFLAITLGYGVFYTARLPLSVAKKPLLDSGLLDAAQLGAVGSALLAAYAVGKGVNGFLGDRVHLPRFFAAGLLLSALANVLFGLSSAYPAFLLLWGCNGWFQSVGAATCGVTLACWFPPRELGTRYALWSLSHNIGEGLTFAGTALLVSALGWRWGFLGPGLLCSACAVALAFAMLDRPASLGLRAENAPPGADGGGADLGALQRAVLRNPMVWLLGLASACLYVARYAINNWGVLYLQVERGYSLSEAGFAVSLVPIVGAAGTVSSGVISDRLFGGRRGPVTLAYGVLLLLSLAALLHLPGGRPGLLAAALSAFGFAVGGQMVFLGGLAAIDLCSKRASGAVMGVVGTLSYVGAAAQDVLSGALLQVPGPAPAYDFGRVKPFWLGAALLSLLLALPLLRAERRR